MFDILMPKSMEYWIQGLSIRPNYECFGLYNHKIENSVLNYE